MATLDDLTELLTGIEDWCDRFTVYFQHKFTQEFHKESKQILSEIAPVIERGVRDAYKKAIDKYYSDYTPIAGGYQRQGGLYDLLDYQTEHDNLDGEAITGGFSYSFDEGKLKHGLRSGGGKEYILYKFFAEGYHGGAIDKGTGAMRYRVPLHRYTAWGRSAEQMNPPPLEVAEDEITKELDSGKTMTDISRIATEHTLAATNRAVTDVASNLHTIVMGVK